MADDPLSLSEEDDEQDALRIRPPQPGGGRAGRDPYAASGRRGGEPGGGGGGGGRSRGSRGEHGRASREGSSSTGSGSGRKRSRSDRRREERRDRGGAPDLRDRLGSSGRPSGSKESVGERARGGRGRGTGGNTEPLLPRQQQRESRGGGGSGSGRDRDQRHRSSGSSSSHHHQTTSNLAALAGVSSSDAIVAQAAAAAAAAVGGGNVADDDRRRREDRLKRFMNVDVKDRSRREDLEVRKKKRMELEQKMMDYEDRLKKKRDRSAEGDRRKRAKKETSESEEGEDSEEASEDDDDSGEEDSGSDDESGEESSEEEEEEGEETDSTASEHVEGTPEHESDEIQEVSPEKRSKKHKKKKKYHRQRQKKKRERRSQEEEEVSDDGREEGEVDAKDEEEEDPVRAPAAMDEDRTPSRSPTPRRAERYGADDDEDDEDERLEEALRGQLLSKKAERDRVAAAGALPPGSRHGSNDEGTPHSQGSFGDRAEGEGEEPKPSVDAEAAAAAAAEEERSKLPPYLPSIYGCRWVEEYHNLNRIEEGTYGVVYRARDKKTKEIVALKRLKMEREKEGFPITSLREINTLLIAQHENVVTVREIVVGSNMDKIYIVMDFVEHDLKGLMETMREKKQMFTPGEVKCLMIQLLKAIAHLHDNWIIHRDLKTSNLLLSNNGILKVGDFGLAREFGSPLKPYTPIVVTLWYRAPELLLGQREYKTHIDVWSCGCIFGELLQMEPLFPAKSEQDQLNRIFKLLGTPSERTWPGFNKLPMVQKMKKFIDYPISDLRSKFPPSVLSDSGMRLLKELLRYDPSKRISCEEALDMGYNGPHNSDLPGYFRESPAAVKPSMFPTWPAKSELSAAERAQALARKKAASPKPPSGGGAFKKIKDADDPLEALHAAAAAGGGDAGGAPTGVGFDFVARNSTSNLAEWKLKF